MNVPMTERGRLDFDKVSAWGPVLTTFLASTLTCAHVAEMRNREFKFVQDSRDHLRSVVGRSALDQAVSSWLGTVTVAGYHGSRLTSAEVESVRKEGLQVLDPLSRKVRLARALSGHPNWSDAMVGLDRALTQRAEGRAGQAHLTLSKSGLTRSFNHYLAVGSEFDMHVAHQLLGEEGVALLRLDGRPMLVEASIPGPDAIAACNPWGLNPHDGPNLLAAVTAAFSYWLSQPDWSSADLEEDCGMGFFETVSADWIINVTPWEFDEPTTVEAP